MSRRLGCECGKIGVAILTANKVARKPPQNGPRTHDHYPLRTRDRMDIVTPEPTSVYRYYDKSGLLLYVGITSRGMRRQAEHNRDKEWWPYVTSQRVEHYDTREEALRREKALIHEYRTPFNRIHNSDHESLRTLYLASQQILPETRPPVTPIMPAKEAYHAVGGKVPLTQIEAGDRGVFAVSITFRDVLRSCVPSHQPVLLRAPKKRGVLTGVDIFSEHPQLIFINKRGGIPYMKNVVLHVKVSNGRPFVLRMHEAVGEVAGT